MKYSVDSSSLISSWNTLYTPEVFPGVWERLAEAVEAGHVRISEAVYMEIAAQNDDLRDWVEVRRDTIVVPLDESIQLRVLELEASFPRLVDKENERDFADPFVIALAEQNGAAAVNEEQPVGPDAKKLKIPNVCSSLAVPSINFLQMLQREKWRF